MGLAVELVEATDDDRKWEASPGSLETRAARDGGQGLRLSGELSPQPQTRPSALRFVRSPCRSGRAGSRPHLAAASTPSILSALRPKPVPLGASRFWSRRQPEASWPPKAHGMA